jgi:DNA adenine methylase
MSNYSPLRYPGGKSAIYPVISSVIKSNKMKHCIYVEPFAGGASIAWNLLIDGIVDYAIINDADKAVYSFWRAVTESTQWFIEKIKTTPITVDEWRIQREILRNSKKYSKELGFAMFFLNRTNRSGILDAGPIGGYDQAGEYKLDCRFNRDALIKKIQKISEYRNRIKVYNQDIFVFLKRFLPQHNKNNNIFVYFDPPYFEKGQRLYMNYFSSEDHERLRDAVSQLDCKWIMTYDDKSEIGELYKNFHTHRFSINYSLSNKKKGGELMIFKDTSCIPSFDVVNQLSRAVSFANICLEGNTMTNCRFCGIVNGNENAQKPENTKIAENEKYIAISSIGALVEGWTLIVPKQHCCSMKDLYSDEEFSAFANQLVSVLTACYGPVIAFEHGPNREGSDTSCGTDHAHIHIVPYHSLLEKLGNMQMEWQKCNASNVCELVGGNEYLFYCEPNGKWDDPDGCVHILKESISQFFRRVIADELGILERFNYKTNPDTDLTLKTIEKVSGFYAKCCEV